MPGSLAWGIGMRIGIAAGLALVAAALLIACRPVVTTSPIGTTVGTGADPRLIGSWVDIESAKEPPFIFTLQKDGSIKADFCADQTPRGCERVFFRVQTARLGAWRYIDAVQIGPTADWATQRHFPVLYNIDPQGELSLYLMMNIHAAAEAVKSGKIAGTVQTPEDGPDVTITGAPAALDAFLATPQARGLFIKPFAILKREK